MKPSGKLRGSRRRFEATIKLDYDNCRRPPEIGLLMLRLRRAGYRPLWLWQRRSPSRKGWHVALAVEPVPRSPEEVVALQAILGSDPQREACNLWRARQVSDGKMGAFGAQRWNVLYY